MIRTLIVEPNPKGRERIRKELKAYDQDFQIVQEVSKITEVFSELKRQSVDLIISDMRLDDGTGYQLFKEIKEQFPYIKVILLIGISEKTSIQEVLKEGLLGYILKPFHPQGVTSCLEEAKQYFRKTIQKEQEQIEIQRQYNQNMPLFQDRFLINLIHGHIKDEDEIQQLFQYFHLNLEPHYTVIIIKANQYREMKLGMEEEQRQFFIFSTLHLVERHMEHYEKKGIAFINRFDEITVILGEDMFSEKIIEWSNIVKEQLANEEGIYVTIGVGRSYPFAQFIDISYKQAKGALRHRFYLGENEVIHIDFVEENNEITYAYSLKEEELLVYETVNGNEKEALYWLERLFIPIQTKNLNDNFMPKVLLDILVSINRKVSEQGIDFDSFFSAHSSMKDMLEKQTLEEAYEYLKDIIIQWCKARDQLRQVKEQEILIEAEKYVERFYFDKISIQRAALFLKTTPKYLGAIFEKYKNTTFYEYCIGVRFEKAKHLLMNNALDLETIAKQVGFQNGAYFSSLFYQTLGHYPQDYRKPIE